MDFVNDPLHTLALCARDALTEDQVHGIVMNSHDPETTKSHLMAIEEYSSRSDRNLRLQTIHWFLMAVKELREDTRVRNEFADPGTDLAEKVRNAMAVLQLVDDFLIRYSSTTPPPSQTT